MDMSKCHSNLCVKYCHGYPVYVGMGARAASGWVGERLVNAMHLFYGYESSSFHPFLSVSAILS